MNQEGQQSNFNPGRDKLRSIAKSKPFKIAVCILLSLGICECLVRVFGYKPWQYEFIDAKEPTMHAPHPILGWRAIEGKYVVPPYSPKGKPIHFTFLKSGRRFSGNDDNKTDGEILLIGGSWMQGWAISDHETAAWKLQEKYSSMKISNYATGGYGSYQSLLALEEQLPEMDSPKFVIYGFIEHHEYRNVAPESWMRTLALFSKRGLVETPFATCLEGEEITRHPPMGYVSLPFRESSALINLIGDVYMKITTQSRLHQKRLVTEKIILTMDRFSKKHGAELIVTLLEAKDDTKESYLKFLHANKISFIDCIHPLTPEMQVLGEGHPNGKMHSIWAGAISKLLDEKLASEGQFDLPILP